MMAARLIYGKNLLKSSFSDKTKNKMTLVKHYGNNLYLYVVYTDNNLALTLTYFTRRTSLVPYVNMYTYDNLENMYKITVQNDTLYKWLE